MNPSRAKLSQVALSVVICAVISDRVAKGHAFMVNASRGRSHQEFDLWQAALLLPSPTSSRAAHCGTQLKAALEGSPCDVFCHSTLPQTSIDVFIDILLTAEMDLPAPCHMHMMILLERFSMMNPDIFMHRANTHRLLLAAFALASNQIYGEYISTKKLGYILRVTRAEQEVLKKSFLVGLNRETSISREELEQYEVRLIKEAIDSTEGLKVLQVLREESIECLDAIVCSTKAWAAVDMRPGTMCEGTESFWLCQLWKRASIRRNQLHRCRIPSHDMLSQMAHALHEYSFGEFFAFQNRYNGRKEGITLEQYAQGASLRLKSLHDIIDGVRGASTTVPGMKLRDPGRKYCGMSLHKKTLDVISGSQTTSRTGIESNRGGEILSILKSSSE